MIPSNIFSHWLGVAGKAKGDPLIWQDEVADLAADFECHRKQQMVHWMRFMVLYISPWWGCSSDILPNAQTFIGPYLGKDCSTFSKTFALNLAVLPQNIVSLSIYSSAN